MSNDTPIPDLVGDDGRARILASALRDLQVQLESLRVQQMLNASADGDIVPGLSQTYAERRHQIEAALVRLALENPDSLERIAQAASESV